MTPHEAEIVALRRKRPPVSYSKIAELLREKHQITISKVGVFEFIKHRVKKDYKPCKYDAWDIKLPEANNQPITTTAVIEKPTASKPSVTEKPKEPEEFIPPEVELKYSDEYNLTILPPEIAKAWLKRIEEKEKERNRK